MDDKFWFKMHFKEWLASTSGMDANIKGWYIDLLCQQAEKGSLPNDIETLAQLANVKYSEFETFKIAFKHTLENKFKKQTDGTLANIKLKKIMNKNYEYSSQQKKRAIVGALIKKGRKYLSKVTDEDWKKVSSELMKNENLENLNIKEKEKCLKHTLKAVINYDFNSNSYINSKHFEKSEKLLSNDDKFLNLVCNYFSQTTIPLKSKVNIFLSDLIHNQCFDTFKKQTMSYIEYKRVSGQSKIHHWKNYTTAWKEQDWTTMLLNAQKTNKSTVTTIEDDNR